MPASEASKGLPIAITQGDCAGIGPEIIAKAFRAAPQALRGCFVVGELQTLRRATAIAAMAVTQIGFGISDDAQLAHLQSGVDVRPLTEQ